MNRCRPPASLTTSSAALLALALSLPLANTTASATDALPAGTINLMVGFAPGGAADTAARLVAKKLTENIGQTVLVQNRAGAGGNIVHKMVADAEPDGSTILLGSIGPLAIAPHLMQLPYDPERDLAPLTMGVSFPNILIVGSGVGVKTLAEFVTLAREKPGQLTFGSSGPGSASHLAGELFNQRAGVDIVHVPYKGGSQAIIDLIAGRVTAYYSTPSTAAPHLESGKVVALATTGLARPPFTPDVPTIAEVGFEGFNASNWYAFVAPGKTPQAILDRWNAELVKALTAPDVRDQLVQLGLVPAPGSRDELRRYIASESASWGKLIKERKITAQ